jgi:hypothetical protein
MHAPFVPGSVGPAVLVAGLAAAVMPPDAIILRHDVAEERSFALGAEVGGPIVDMRIPFRDATRVGVNGMGTLVGPRHVVTAAHVAAALVPGHPLSRVEGTHEVRVGGLPYPVAAVALHPSWRPGGPGPHDIAVVTLAVPVVGAHPALLYDGTDEVGREIVIAGMGDAGTGLTGPSVSDGRLRAATHVVDGIFDGQLVFDFDPPDSPDATELEGVSGPGDSGGPAFIRDGGRLHLVGVSVAQDGQGRGPGRYGAREFYTRVSDHVDWIRSVVADRRVPEK